MPARLRSRLRPRSAGARSPFPARRNRFPANQLPAHRIERVRADRRACLFRGAAMDSLSIGNRPCRPASSLPSSFCFASSCWGSCSPDFGLVEPPRSAGSCDCGGGARRGLRCSHLMGAIRPASSTHAPAANAASRTRSKGRHDIHGIPHSFAYCPARTPSVAEPRSASWPMPSRPRTSRTTALATAAWRASTSLSTKS